MLFKSPTVHGKCKPKQTQNYRLPVIYRQPASLKCSYTRHFFFLRLATQSRREHCSGDKLQIICRYTLATCLVALRKVEKCSTFSATLNAIFRCETSCDFIHNSSLARQRSVASCRKIAPCHPLTDPRYINLKS